MERKQACIGVTAEGSSSSSRAVTAPALGLLQGLGQAVHPSGGSWARVGFSLPPVRIQWKQLAHTWLQQGEAPVPWKQHQPSPAHLYVLPCCHHTPSPYPSPVTLSLLPPAALPCPQSQLLYPCPALPLPPVFLQPTHHQFYTLPQLSHSLFYTPEFPGSCLDVSFFPTLNKPVLLNRPTSFPT